MWSVPLFPEQQHTVLSKIPDTMLDEGLLFVIVVLLVIAAAGIVALFSCANRYLLSLLFL